MKTKKKIILVLAFIALGVLIAGSAYTYAKYFTKTTGTMGTKIKQWDILINNETIRNKTTLTNSITATFPNTNGHTAQNKIAPGVEGYFDINIDYSHVELNFQYDLSIKPNDTIPDIQLTTIEVNGVAADPSQITTDAEGITHVTGNINVATATTTSQTIKVYVKWVDSATGPTMDNEADTQATIDGVAAIKVNLNVVQIH